MTDSNFRDLVADDSWASSFQSLGQYRTALLKTLDASLNPKTENEILRFLDSQGFINGEVEENKDGTLRWTYKHKLNGYDGDDDWEEMDATDTILGVVRWIREASFLGPIPKPIAFRFRLNHPISGVYVEACDRLRNHWVIREGCCYLNKEGKWENPMSLSYEEFCEKFSWLTAKEASTAYCNMPQPLTLQQKQAAEITALKAQLAIAAGLIANCKSLPKRYAPLPASEK
jgi:hypothetical protein